eukprot:366192-Chlamydomonas_euryale.AAC.10
MPNAYAIACMHACRGYTITHVVSNSLRNRCTCSSDSTAACSPHGSLASEAPNSSTSSSAALTAAPSADAGRLLHSFPRAADSRTASLNASGKGSGLRVTTTAPVASTQYAVSARSMASACGSTHAHACASAAAAMQQRAALQQEAAPGCTPATTPQQQLLRRQPFSNSSPNCALSSCTQRASVEPRFTCRTWPTG